MVRRAPLGPLTQGEVDSLIDEKFINFNDGAREIRPDGTSSEWKLLWQFDEFNRRKKEPDPQFVEKLPEERRRRRPMTPEEIASKVEQSAEKELLELDVVDLLKYVEKPGAAPLTPPTPEPFAIGLLAQLQEACHSPRFRWRIGVGVGVLALTLSLVAFLPPLLQSPPQPKRAQVTPPAPPKAKTKKVRQEKTVKAPPKKKAKPRVTASQPPPPKPKRREPIEQEPLDDFVDYPEEEEVIEVSTKNMPATLEPGPLNWGTEPLHKGLDGTYRTLEEHEIHLEEYPR